MPTFRCSPCFSCRACRPLLTPISIKLADARDVQRLERVDRQDLLIDVFRHERADVVAREAEGHLRQVVGAERKELGLDGDLVGRQGGAGNLDHRADRVVDLDAGLLHELVGDRDGSLLEERQLLDRADQGNHDLRQHGLALLLDVDRGFDDGPDLHVADFGILDRQPAAAQAEHRVLLVKLLDAPADLFDRDAKLPRNLGLAGRVVVLGQELVQRRVEQPDRHRQPVHRLEDADEVLLLERLELGQRGLPAGFVVGQDHLPHGDDSLVAEEHVLGAAQADSLGPERAGAGPSLPACRQLVRTFRVRTLSAQDIKVAK